MGYYYLKYKGCRVPKRMFFWGRFTDEHTLLDYLQKKPKSFRNAIFGKLKGKLADYTNLTDEEFLLLLGKLAIRERLWYVVIDVHVISDNNQFHALMYTEVSHKHVSNREREMYQKGSKYWY